MDIKLFDSELNVMKLLWQEGELTAKELAERLSREIGWNKNTTYTVIKKCVDKQAVQRIDPGFICRPLISREKVQRQETDELINKMFGGSSELFFSSFLKEKGVDAKEAQRLLEFIKNTK